MHSGSHPITIAILAGGASRRMGRSKHGLVHDGRTLIELIVQTCREISDRIIISGSDSILPELPHVTDRLADAGPLAGIEAILSSGIGDRYLIVPCDMPGLLPEDMQRLVTPEADLVVFERMHGSHRRSLPACIHARLLPMVVDHLESGNRSVHGFIEQLDAEEVAAPPESRLININEPDDWSRWCESRTDG